MMTPTQLLDRLAQLGIKRSERVLIDWRAKGLLPPLRSRGQGRGKGQLNYWSDEAEILDRAIAVHYLLGVYARTEFALLGLWASGFRVEAKKVRTAWMNLLESERKYVESEASRFRDDYLGLGKSTWRLMGRPRLFGEYVGGLFDSYYHDRNRDDAGDQANLASVTAKIDGKYGEPSMTRDEVCDLLVAICTIGAAKKKKDTKGGSAVRQTTRCVLELSVDAIAGLTDSERQSIDETYRFTDAFWMRLDLATMLRSSESMAFVHSMTDSEFDKACPVLADVRALIGRCIALTKVEPGMRPEVEAQIALASSLGQYLSRQLTMLSRKSPDWPMAESIRAIHDLAMRVKLSDVSRRDKKYRFSERAGSEWAKTRQELAQLWESVTKDSPYSRTPG